MKTPKAPGEPITPCTQAPALRAIDPDAKPFRPTEKSEGYTAPGHVKHFLPDREVNLAQLTKSLADVFGEPALRIRDLHLEIDEGYWTQICEDPWSGNIYRYSF
ncbi:hypothetical protein EV659_10129 [Rhodothalassium salexigens DSM 2132]|uniref:Uncharacterized protein n=1 Tax=Rhodothalassium salexigens DSM 2132 TaxID=1188247 RepID=A0A4R2PVC4_RHOSA|nr:hypothetical protein [Rhodothalassium salexigens]MBB4209970.1 hypothetical protein [Rhodothalassium salexigens DSM 2132]MBK1637658.1 hypothetical protein [Rhodothalassium salexigens DSM 2132]TCP38135.1 hypothetical protein EV659_10129 [Rhodothalassium salexigens DSM 2132]